MKQHTAFKKAPFSLATYVTVLVMLIGCLAGMWVIFSEAGLVGLNSDQRSVLNFLFALIAGGTGFFIGRVALTFTRAITPNTKMVLRAFGGSALFLVVLFKPELSSMTGTSQTPVSAIDVIEITSPMAGSLVQSTVQLHGRTARPSWHHYVVVAGPAQGSYTVQDAEANVSAAGDLSAQATLGNATVGAGETFTILIVACEKRLNPGPFVRRNDQIVSTPISVVRAGNSERS
jgi:hypothetical protein